MTENTDEASRGDGINDIDSGRENSTATSDSITDPVSAVEPAPFEGLDNNQTRMAATASENFTVPTSAVEPSPVKAKCGVLPHGAYACIPALLSTIAWLV